MIIVIRFKYVLFYLISLVLLLGLLFGRVVMVRQEADGVIKVVLISFLPLKTAEAPAHLTVTSSDPRQTFRVDFSHSRFFKIAIKIREGRFPKGSPVTIKLTRLPTWISGINRSFCRTVLPRIKPEVMQGPPRWSGTRNPLTITFNTPIRFQGLKQLIRVDFPARLTPCRRRIRKRAFTDYATWRIIPTRPLQHHFSYRIILQSGLTGIGGQKLARACLFRFTTVPSLKVVTQFPTPDSLGVPQYLPLRLTADRKLRCGRVWLPGHSGETLVSGKTLFFTPSQVLLPDTLYQARAMVVDRYGETAAGGWRFRTGKLTGNYWVEVNLRLPQTIRVYRGKRLLKTIRVSGPAPQLTTLRGCVFLKSRGYAFYSPKLHEGAYYWLRLANGWLVHSTPFGPDGQIKPGMLAGLGKPGEAGSVRMAMADIRWLYQNLPANTPLLIHGPAVMSNGTNGETANHYDNACFFNYRVEYESFMQSVSQKR